MLSAFNKPIRYQEFLKLAMPKGIDAKELWEFVMMLQHCAGETQKIRPWFNGLEKQECWFFLCNETMADLYKIVSLASGESRLNTFFSENDTFDYNFLENVFEETANLAHYDGISLTAHNIAALWTGRADPTCPEEQIIVNFSEAFYNVKKLVSSKAYSRMLISDIQDMLWHKVNKGSVHLRPSYHWANHLCNMNVLNSPDYAAETLDAIITRTEERPGSQNVVMSSIIASKSLCDVPYVDSLRNLTEYLLRRTYFLKNNMPALSYVPFSSLNDLRYNTYQEAHAIEAVSAPKEGLCATWNYTAGIKAYLEGVQSLEAMMKSMEEGFARLRVLVSRIPHITARQKSFLLSALRNPNQPYSIKQYMRAYGVVYSTARKDLLDLVDLGYLSMQKQHGAMLFKGVPPR